MRARLFILLILTSGSAALHGQISVGGKQFVRAPEEMGRKGEWVLYEKGAPRNDGTSRWLTKRVLVEMAPGKAAADLRQVAGAVKTTPRGKYAVVEFGGNPGAALAGADRLRKLPGVRSAEPMLARQLFRRFEPDDPLFAYDAARPGYQWHLRNTEENGGEAGIDVNVTTAWDTCSGDGVRIGIVDDGLEVGHPDLLANVDLDNGYDFNDRDGDPSPGEKDSHGTACAGVAAARGGNGIGVTGVAPEATLVGLRLIAAPTTDLEEADAFAFRQNIIQIKSNSWGPYDGAYGTGGPGPLSLAALENAATTGRDGKGTVFLWAAGNGNYSGDDSNYDGWANTPRAIAVSAINDKGRSSWYSEPGANILVCAPSSGGEQGITTTDRTSSAGYNEEGGTVEYPDFPELDYTNTFGGTSSATPAVAGVVALMLEANPALTVRDVQEILVRTAVKNDPFNGGWVTNGAGYHFHERYGAGLVDASAATAMAATWTNVAPRETRVNTQTGLALAIPDAEETGASHIFPVASGDNLRLEHVTVHVKATHPYAGNLEWRLTSPSGVTARLARARFNDTSEDLDWTFMATHFWGERSEGDWTLEVIDRMVDYAGTLDEATITFHGTLDGGERPAPVITSNWIIVGREGWEMNHQITASNFATSFDAGRYVFNGFQWVMTDPPAGLHVDSATGLITGTPTETGLFEGYQSARNALFTTDDFAYFYILAADPSLSDAVEQPPSTKIVPFGYGDPFRQTAVSQDGEDAIETAEVDHEEYSGIEFTVEGPAKLEFQWKVSSEKNYDYLVLAVDGWVRDYITGETDWTLSTTYLGEGPHNVDIYYTKDEATAKGQDKGWIDQITVTSTFGDPPVITAETVQAYQGVYFRHQLEATNAPSTWSADDLPSGLTLHKPTGLIYGSVVTLGTYPVTIHATNSSGTGTKTITIQVGTVEEGLAAAIDAPHQVVSTSGNLGWAPQQLYSSDGEDAARSGPVSGLEQSVMTTEVSGPCKVTFYWGVSSEAGYDFLRFYIDDVEQDAISGEVGWTRKGFLLSEGAHTLKWAYIKDDYTDSGLDSGFVDRLETHLDADGDGAHADIEAWFGTSDASASTLPQPSLTRTGSGATLEFPSVSGRDYRIEYSDDLIDWTPVIVTAEGTTTTWTDLNAANKTRRFYRIRIP